MNTDEYDELSAAEKRIKVAELCGYNFLIPPENCGLGQWNDSEWNAVDELPDYLSDLNACHEFEKQVPESKELEYTDALSCLVSHKSGYDNLWRATAEQRCKAFVLTMEAA